MQEPNEPIFISPNFFLEKLGPEFQGRQTYDAVLYYFGKYFERVKTEPEYTLPWTIVRETKTSFALEDSPRAQRAVRNILFLHSLSLRPKSIMEFVAKRPSKRAAKELEQVFQSARELAQNFKIVHDAESAGRDLLVGEKVDLSKTSLSEALAAAPRKAPTAGPSPSPVMPGGKTLEGQLLQRKHLEELEREPRSARRLAEMAFHNLELGRYVVAGELAAEARGLNPEEPLALAMEALLLVLSGTADRRHSATMAFLEDELSQEASDCVLASLGIDSSISAEAAADKELAALDRFARALETWPAIDTHREWRDLWLEVLRKTLALAANHADRLSRSGPYVPDRTETRRRVILAAKTWESYADRRWLLRRERDGFAHDELRFFVIFKALDAGEYQRFGEAWLARLETSSGEEALAYLETRALSSIVGMISNIDLRLVMDVLERRARRFVEETAATARAMGALHALRENRAAGRLERAFEDTPSLHLDRYAGPRFGIHYGRLRVALELVAERLEKRDRAELNAFLVKHGAEIEELTRTLAALEVDAYLEQAGEDDYDYVDVFRHEPDLLPRDPGIGEGREETSALERIDARLRASGLLSADGAKTIERVVAAAREGRGGRAGAENRP